MSDARQDPAQAAAAVISMLLTSTEKGREAAERVEPDVLELRLHGVANTAPQDLLDLPREEVELAAGDTLGSFWQPTPLALLRRTRARSEPIRDRGEIPAGVHREAYSWGGMVRTTGDRGLGGAIVAGLARAGWALLLPFAMANTAIWSMRLPTDGPPKRSARAFVMRVAGLFLTLLLVASVSVLALDIGALQCLEPAAAACPGLPDMLRALSEWTLGARLAALSLVPVLVIAGLWLLANSSRVRYDVADRFNLVGAAAGRRPTASMFTDPRYWLRDGETARLASMHFAAGVGLVATILFTTWEGDVAWVGQIGFWIALSVTLVAIVTAGCTATMPFERPHRVEPRAPKPRGRWHRAVVIAGVATWVGAAALQVFVAGNAWTGLTVSGRFHVPHERGRHRGAPRRIGRPCGRRCVLHHPERTGCRRQHSLGATRSPVPCMVGPRACRVPGHGDRYRNDLVESHRGGRGQLAERIDRERRHPRRYRHGRGSTIGLRVVRPRRTRRIRR